MYKWSEILSPEAMDKAKELLARAKAEAAAGHTIYPPQGKIFNALTLTPPDAVKVVIIGQDPYHGPGQANGLAFSVNPGVAIPPSLRNIFKELHDDIGCPIPTSGDLTPWAERGVLLLNTSLTVERGKPTSHSGWGWQEFVLDVCQACTWLLQPIVFLLWGGHARAFTAGLQILARTKNKCSICSSHPSPLGATKGGPGVPAFLGSRPFSQANRFLEAHGAEPVDWVLP